jgi:hypothetical protein
MYAEKEHTHTQIEEELIKKNLFDSHAENVELRAVITLFFLRREKSYTQFSGERRKNERERLKCVKTHTNTRAASARDAEILLLEHKRASGGFLAGII